METGILSELGLSKNEIEVYLTLLELGTSTAVHIAKAAKLHRPNVYDALDRLSKKAWFRSLCRKEQSIMRLQTLTS